MGKFLVWVNWGEKTHYNYGYNHPRLDKNEKASWTAACPSLCLLSWWQTQCHHMLLAFSSKRDCVPYTCKPKWKLLALFHVKCFVMATRKGKACVAYPRTIKKAPILYITLFLWVYSLLPWHFEHINSLQHHTQCCFVKEGCNLIFLFLWVICVLSLKAC